MIKKDKNTFICFIQARMNSTRFPGKILKKIREESVLDLVIERVSKSKKIGKIVILTSTSSIDNEVCK